MSVSVRRDGTRERGVALTTATIDTSVNIPASPFAEEIEDAYAEFAIQQAIGDTDMDAVDAIVAAGDEASNSPFELALLCDKITYSLRPNPRAQAMTRRGRRYCIRRDHGTKVFYQEIDEANAARDNRQKNSRAAKRKLAKLTDYSGNPRVITKLKKLGDLLVD